MTEEKKNNALEFKKKLEGQMLVLISPKYEEVKIGKVIMTTYFQHKEYIILEDVSHQITNSEKTNEYLIYEFVLKKENSNSYFFKLKNLDSKERLVNLIESLIKSNLKLKKGN